MLRGSLQLCSIRGIPIRIHFTWLIIFGLVSWTLASGYFPQHYPDLPVAAYWLKGSIAALLLFGSILVHELMHGIMAQKLRMPIGGITLFALGGVAELKGEPPTAGTEFKVAIIGPLTSFILAGVFWVVWKITEDGRMGTIFSGIAAYLVMINIVVALFNLLPAFPLDGGRVLRAILWRITQNVKQATSWATRIGQGVAYLLILLGAVALFLGAGFQGVWMAVIGVFLLQSAQASYTQLVVQQALAGIAVRDIMIKEVTTVPPQLRVTDLIDQYFLTYGYGGFPVEEHGRVLGLVSLRRVKQVPPEARDQMSVREVMRPLEERLTIAPDDDTSVAFRRMAEEDLGRLVVMERGRLVGLVTKTGLSRFLQMKLELQL